MKVWSEPLPGTDLVINLARHARSVGADGVLATPPPYAHPNPDELVNFYRTISDGVDIPLMIYNWPRGVAVDIDTETVSRLADIPNVAGCWPGDTETSSSCVLTLIPGKVCRRCRAATPRPGSGAASCLR